MKNDPTPMTIAQLITELQKIEDQNAVLLMEGCDCDAYCISITVDKGINYPTEVYMRRG